MRSIRFARATGMGRVARASLGALACAVVLSLPSSAHAGVAIGDQAPSWTAKEFFNHDGLTLEGLRGRLVFIEFFGTG